MGWRIGCFTARANGKAPLAVGEWRNWSSGTVRSAHAVVRVHVNGPAGAVLSAGSLFLAMQDKTHEVLVLNHNYQPLNVTNVRRALVLIVLGKAEMVRTDSAVFRSEKRRYPLPTVVRLSQFVRRPIPVLQASRKSILARDHYACQYCGAQRVALTIDHVIPKDRGGHTDWDNLVCCCTRCNNIKGNRAPEEVGMTLLRKPRRPKFIPYISYTKFVSALKNPHWHEFLAPYADGG